MNTLSVYKQSFMICPYWLKSAKGDTEGLGALLINLLLRVAVSENA